MERYQRELTWLFIDENGRLCEMWERGDGAGPLIAEIVCFYGWGFSYAEWKF